MDPWNGMEMDLAAALKELKRLKGKVRELEEQVAMRDRWILELLEDVVGDGEQEEQEEQEATIQEEAGIILFEKHFKGRRRPGNV